MKGPTKNRKRQVITVDGRVLDIFRERLAETERVAAAVGCEVAEDPFVFTVLADGSEPWTPTR